MFSKTCEYAIRALIYIAQHSKGGAKVGIKSITQGIDSPEHFIAKILQDLSRRGLVSSIKGPNGGFYMTDQELNNSLADIVEIIDGEKIFTGCALGLKQCSEVKPCPMHNHYKPIRKKINDMLRSAKIGEVSDQLALSESFLKIT